MAVNVQTYLVEVIITKHLSKFTTIFNKLHYFEVLFIGHNNKDVQRCQTPQKKRGFCLSVLCFNRPGFKTRLFLLRKKICSQKLTIIIIAQSLVSKVSFNARNSSFLLNVF